MRKSQITSVECGFGPDELSDVDPAGERIALVDPPDRGVLEVRVEGEDGSMIDQRILHADQTGPVEVPGDTKVLISVPNGSKAMTYSRRAA